MFRYGDTPDLAALIAPRPLHLNFGDQDGGSPIVDVHQGVKSIQQAYDGMHAGDKFSWFIEENTGHVLSDTMWQKTRDWFGQHLK